MSEKRQDWEKDLEREFSNVGKELESAMQDLASEFQKNVAPALKNASLSFGKMVKDMAQEFGESAQKSSSPARALKKRERKLKKLRNNYKSLEGTALGLGITAFIMAAITGMVVLSGESQVEAWGVTALMAVAFAIPALICQMKSYPARRLVVYHQILDGRSYCKMEEFAAAVDLPVGKAKREIRRMIQQGSFEGMFLAPDASRLFTSRAAYAAYVAQCAQKEQIQTPVEQPVHNGTVDELRSFWTGLRMEKRKILDAAVLGEVEKLDAQTAQLIAWLETHPEDENDVKRFTTYYLPTTLKLLRTYNEVGNQTEQSHAAAQIQADIMRVLGTINTAFSSLQDGLLQDTALDVSAEVSAMETVLVQDGLKPDEFSNVLKK
ncbi:hypothetical protein [uncultured Ruthenibacterium sp.]|uniref:hypothetical protein n=1 Tax=uncultured Ruthenibacterium sp. TaxID=1905347 RepID=UPI00349EED47